MSDTEAKKHEASDQKLNKEREKGNVASAVEMSAFVSTALGIVMMVGLVPMIFRRLGKNFETTANSFGTPFAVAVQETLRDIGTQLALAVVPLVIASGAIAILASIIYNKGILFALKPITPDLQRISPMAGLKRLFSTRTLVEVGTGVVRLAIWFACAYFIMRSNLKDILALNHCGKSCVVDIAVMLLYSLMLIALLLLIVSIIVEMILQKSLFMKEQKMTETEVKKEQKDQMGSNEVRQERKRLRDELAQTAEAGTVHNANMCFYSGDMCVAVRYHPEHATIPRISAKSKSAEKTAKIRGIVAENGFRELEHHALVQSVINIEQGHDIGADHHDVLIDALKKLFST